jgi:predicted house-cleaning noncanonical NTP pyrophosphatase (MazG superfamily)
VTVPPTESARDKASGLRTVPTTWVPPYVVLDRIIVDPLSAATAASRRQALAARLAEPDLAPQLDALVSLADRTLTVRSNAIDEDLDARGLYTSVLDVPCSLPAIADAAEQVWSHAERLGLSDGPIPLIVQAQVRRTLIGHLSNERRLARDRRSWRVELYGEFRQGGVRQFRVRSHGSEPQDLTAVSEAEVLVALRAVASSLTKPGHRYHLEWVWDGVRMWIVQCDPADERADPLPTITNRAVPLADLSCFVPIQNDHRRFPKAACLLRYRDAELPVADVYILDDGPVIKALAESTPSPQLDADLRLLATARAVVRTDVAVDGPDFEVMLPRTDSGLDEAGYVGFLQRTAQRLLEDGVDPTKIAFLAHAFIPAEAAAWSLAAPTSSRVRIDATFGLPDGLVYNSHDSYEVDLREGSVRRQLRCKSRILVEDAAGHWENQPIGAPADWRSTISDNEALQVADMSRRLAAVLDRPVETMFFLRVRAADGDVDALPWVHRVEDINAHVPPATPPHFARQSIVVRAERDVERLRAFLDVAEADNARVIVRLAPAADLVHDGPFLDALIRELDGRSAIATVELAGSALAHAYYELVRSGIQVTTAEPLESAPVAPLSFDKLVRDHIPDSIAARGERVSGYRASGDELDSLLRLKVVEESVELAAAVTNESAIEEAGDLVEVLLAVCSRLGTTLGEVQERAKVKRERRGGFSEGLVLVRTREPSLQEAVADSVLGSHPSFGVGDPQREMGSPPVLDDAVIVPISLTGTGRSRAYRVDVDGVTLAISLGPAGITIERVFENADNPLQLMLRVDG